MSRIRRFFGRFGVDLVALVGLGCITAGIAMTSTAAALVFAGVVLCVVAALVATGRPPSGGASPEAGR